MLLKVKRLIYRPMYAFFRWYYFLNFKMLLNSEHKNINVFDLDNTLADTYPYIKTSINHLELPAHKGMTELLKDKIADNQLCIILSARNYKITSNTKKWLEINIGSKKNIPLFLVPRAEDKLPYLMFADKKFENVFYYDDLSYNHENGEVKFYQDVIESIKQTSIHYYGYDEINIINQKRE